MDRKTYISLYGNLDGWNMKQWKIYKLTGVKKHNRKSLKEYLDILEWLKQGKHSSSAREWYIKYIEDEHYEKDYI